MEKLQKPNRVVENLVNTANVAPVADYIEREGVLEMRNIQFLTSKVSDKGNMMPSILSGYSDGQPVQFTGATAEELYEAITEAAKEWFGIGPVKTDGKVTDGESLAVTLLVELTDKVQIKMAKDREGEPLGFYHAHKGHVTGAFGLRYRKIRFGKKAEMVEEWAGRE